MARTPFFKRLPQIWHRLDFDRIAERFTQVLDAAFDRVHGKGRDILDTRSVNRCPDRWVALLSDIVGHVWRSDRSYDWNRRKIASAIRRWSYKGTIECVADIALECGATKLVVVDMASQILTLDLLGELGGDAAFFEDEDFFHDGVFLLFVDAGCDMAAFQAECARIKPAGEKWLFYTLPAFWLTHEFGENLTMDREDVFMDDETITVGTRSCLVDGVAE